MPFHARLTGVSQDFRFALRLLRRAPGPTLVSIVTMSLGIGPSTIEGIAGYTAQPATLTGSGDPQRVRVAEVTASLFPLLGARAAIGSVFTDEVANADSIVLSYALWQQQYGGSHDVLGRVVRIDGEARTILGVMPRAFAFPDTGTQAWVPMNVPPVVVPNSQGRRISIFYAMARLKPGVTAAQAASEATARGRAAPDPGLVTMAIFGTRGPLQVTATPMLQAMT